ncbi:endonuclease/exonuclease/phosphatase family protein [Ensifer sp. 22521]|uniref:endonuclease/exonuclease/phosphatase family protein n=1 Tax=Ensifer sp. 22521 TaxID=3453935 RepID=UPI003F86ED28
MVYLDHMRGLMIAALAVSTNASAAWAADTPIATIQGADHKTTLPTNVDVTISGVVTGHFGKGFFVQSSQPDGDAATSDAIFVFPGNSPIFAIPKRGDTVRVTGKPDEFQPFPEPPIFPTRKVAVCGTTEINEVQSDDRKTFLPITQLRSVTAFEVTGTADLPTPIDFNPPGSTNDIAFADTPNTPFDPVKHPRDYFESLEGMRVVIRDAIVVSRKEPQWDNFWVVPAAALGIDEKSAYGLPLGKPGHIFPEIISVHKAKGQPPFAPSVGTHLGDLTGIMSYENGVYMVVLDELIDVSSLPAPDVIEVPAPTFGEGIRIATYNAENMSIASDGATEKFKRIAGQITGDLNSPSVIGLQEVQDDDGEGATSATSAQLTIKALIDAIGAAGGPGYKAVALDPVLPNTDGGAPGGNIRTVFLVRDDAGLTIKTSERLFDTDDRCDRDANPFASARKPLLLEAAIGDSRYVFVNLHLSSKLGDDGLYTNAEDPKPASTAGRKRQAERLVAELERRYSADRPTIILMGDFNDHADAEALAPFRNSSLGFTFLRDHRGEAFTASYSFNGLREAIDHFVVSGAPNQSAATYMNLNADAQDQVSDHNPVVLEIK